MGTQAAVDQQVAVRIGGPAFRSHLPSSWHEPYEQAGTQTSEQAKCPETEGPATKSPGPSLRVLRL
jgi:hypothetical protein